MTLLIPALVAGTGLLEKDVRLIVATAPARYKSYFIDKRAGGRRLISQPARELKMLQRVLLSELLSKLPVHQAATAYRTGQSIRHNAYVHAENGPILKMDFSNFFPSIKARDWAVYCEKHKIFEHAEDLIVSTNVLFHREKGSTVLKLAIGAPTSPHLSNSLLYDFDEIITRRVAQNNVSYTRYADDITFSARRTGYLQSVEKDVRRILREIKSPKLYINSEKAVLATMKYKRMITGLIISDESRVTIGHRRKRQVRTALYRAGKGLLGDKELLQLAGSLAFINDVEPDFMMKVRERYGEKLIRTIKLAGRGTHR